MLLMTYLYVASSELNSSKFICRPVPESDFPFVPLSSSRPSPAPRKLTAIKNKKAGGAESTTSKSITEAEELTMMEDDIMAQYKNGSETANTEEVPASTEKPHAANANENTTMQVF